jgi:hypothetical protein
MQIYFCERCGKRVSDIDIKKGVAIQVDDLVYCKQCAEAENLKEITAPEPVEAEESDEQGKARRPSGLHPARARRPATPPEGQEVMAAPGVPKWIYGAVVGGVVIGIVILISVVAGGKKEPPMTAPMPPAGQPKSVPVEAAAPKPENMATPAEVQKASEPASKTKYADFVPQGTPSGAPQNGMLVTDFERGARVSQVSDPTHADILQVGDRGNSLVVLKPDGDDNAFGTVRVSFPDKIDLAGFKKIGFYAAAGPVDAQIQVGLVGSTMQPLSAPDSNKTITVGSEWKWYELLLEGDVKEVTGLAITYNKGGEKPGFKLLVDDLTALEPGTVPPASTTPVPVSAPAASPTSGGNVTLADFEGDITNVESKYKHKIEAAADAAHSGGKGLRIIMGAGDDTAQASRVIIKFPQPVDVSRFAGLTLWTGGKDITDTHRAELDFIDDKGDYAYLGTFRFGPQWKEYKLTFNQIDAKLPTNATAFAFYFNKDAKPGPFDVYLDDIGLFGGSSPAPVVSTASATTPAAQAKVILSTDLENSDMGWTLGKRVEDSTHPGSKYAYEATEKVDGFSKRIVYNASVIRPKVETLFDGAKGRTLSFDYFISGDGQAPRFAVTLWEVNTNRNYQFDVRDVSKDAWKTVTIPLNSKASDNASLPDDAKVTEIKIGLLPADQNFMLRVNNLRVVEPGASASVASVAEKVVFSSDFETDANGWENGDRVSDNVPEGSKYAYRAKPESQGQYRARGVNAATYLFNPRRDPIFTVSAGQYISFDYFVTGTSGTEPLQIMFTGTGRPSNPRATISPVLGKWTSVKIPMDKLDTSFPTGPGDKVREVIVNAGPPGADVTLLIDNMKVAEPGAIAQETGTGTAVTGGTPAPVISGPVKTAGISGGEAIVLFSADFDNDAVGFQGGERSNAKTFNNSPGAYKAKFDAAATYFPCSIGIDIWSVGKPKAQGFIQLQANTKLTFAYYLDGANYIQVQYWNVDKNENFYVRQNAQQGVWTIMQVDLLAGTSNNNDGKKCQAGDWLKSLSFFTGDKAKPAEFYIDNVIIHVGDLPADMGSSIAKKIAESKAITGEPMKDGFYLNGEILANLAKYFKPDATEKMQVAILGDDIADSGTILTPLLKAGAPLADHKEPMRSTFASSKSTLQKLTDKLDSAFKKKKPEVLFIMAGYTELRFSVEAPPVNSMTALVKAMVEKCLTEGVCPVLVTLPRKPVQADPIYGRFAEWNKALLQLADQMKVPLIEANKLLGGEDKVIRENFGGEKPQLKGYEKINNMIAKVYLAIEFKVMNRGAGPVTPEAQQPAGPQPPAGQQPPGPGEQPKTPTPTPTPEEQKKTQEDLDKVEI